MIGMLFGAQAARPNTYLQRFVIQTLGRRTIDTRMLLDIVEQAAKWAQLSLRLIDWHAGHCSATCSAGNAHGPTSEQPDARMFSEPSASSCKTWRGQPSSSV
jgi:hypothetical protein